MGGDRKTMGKDVQTIELTKAEVDYLKEAIDQIRSEYGDTTVIAMEIMDKLERAGI